MSSVQEPGKVAAPSNAAMLLEEMKLLGEIQGKPISRNAIHSELWHACAGPLVSLPQPGSLAYYFTQGHSEQVTASTRKTANSHIPNYPNLPPQLMCQVHDVILHADKETDEIYAQMTLRPVNSETDIFPIPDLGHSRSKHPTEFFCKTLTASDTSTHGGFSVPRRAAEKLFPQLDYSMQPPNQELTVRDLHDNLWTFRHIYRGHPKRHLLTTGWSSFVGAKRLKAGDSVLFIRDEKSQLLLGVRRANRQQTAIPSSVLSADSMHIGVLAAAAHAAASCSPFNVYYNPRACPSDFIIPLAKYHKAAYSHLSIGTRFGMMFETEESSKRRYMGTIMGISDYDTLKWPNSKWRNLQVEWDEHGNGEKPDRVSVWEIETPDSLFVFPPTASSLKRQCLPGFVVPGIQIGFANSSTLSQVPEYRTGHLNSAVSSLDTGQLVKMLLKGQRPSPHTNLGHHKSLYASIFQNIKSSDFPITFASTMPATSTIRDPAQREAIVETVMQQERQFRPVEQPKLPLRNTSPEEKNPQPCMEQQGEHINCTSWTCEEPRGQEESTQEEKVQDGNKNDEHGVSILGIVSESSLVSGMVMKKSGNASAVLPNEINEHSQYIVNTPTELLHSEHPKRSPRKEGRKEKMGSLICDNDAKGISADQKLQMKGHRHQEQQHQISTAQTPNMETSHSTDKNDLTDFILRNEYYSSECLDHDELLLQSSIHQSFSNHLVESELLSYSGQPDSSFLLAPDNIISSSGDISAILDPNNFTSTELYPLSINLDSQNPQCLHSFSHRFHGAQELSPLHEQEVTPCMRLSEVHNLTAPEEGAAFRSVSNLSGIRDLSDESVDQYENHNNFNSEASNKSMISGVCVSSALIENFSMKGAHGPTDTFAGNFGSNQDMHSQVTSATDSQVYSLQDIYDISGGTSSGSMDINEYNLLNTRLRRPASSQLLRTYTKVQKLGSVGRSIDVTRFRDYSELKHAIACMFGLEGQLDDANCLEWKLVYVDYENDVLLVGDDPWDEFVNCVRCIKILSPSEVQQMSQEGMQL